MKFTPVICLMLCGFVPFVASGFGRKRAAGSPCPKIRILRAGELKLSDAEIRLLCGNPMSGRSDIAWEDIPPAQAEANFRNFLQDRGYLSPVFRRVEGDADGGIDEFDPGEPTLIRGIRGINFPPEVHLEGYRSSLGHPMTPAELSGIKVWAKRGLQEAGYPCPELKLRGFAYTGEVTLEWMNPSPRAVIVEVKQNLPPPMKGDVPAVTPAVMRRFDAFKLGGPYSLVLTSITERRSTDSKLVSSQDFLPVCASDEDSTPSARELRLNEELQVGPPRLVRLGVSANTEVGPEIHASWAHTRTSQSGSDAEISLKASLIEQAGNARANWYYRESASRQHLSPLLRFSHENELRFELLAFRSQITWENGWESPSGQWRFSSGPGWQNLQQLAGLGPLNRHYASLRTELGYESHTFEYRKGDPRRGFQVSLSALPALTELPGAGHPVHWSLQGTWLGYPGVAEPPWLILGFRGRAFSSIVPSGTRYENLPIDFRQWVGGAQDVRGFGRQELPEQGLGARQGLTGGIELRIPLIIPWGVEPFFFADGAWIQTGPGTDDERSESYWSPGLGFRYASPVGTVRTSLAHGFELSRARTTLSHWQFHLSLGEEF